MSKRLDRCMDRFPSGSFRAPADFCSVSSALLEASVLSTSDRVDERRTLAVLDARLRMLPTSPARRIFELSWTRGNVKT